MKVNIIIGGGQKCGTTALHHYLSQHPQVLASLKKELDFFAYAKNFDRGTAYYHSFFKPSRLQKLLGREKFYMEASPSYLLDEQPEETARRIHDYNPECKVIFSVRNPIDRAFSAFQMYKKSFFSDGGRDGWMNWVRENKPELIERVRRRTEEEFSSFGAFVRSEIDAISNDEVIEFNTLNLGHYSSGLKAFKEYFKLLVISQEDMNANLEDTMSKISSHIGLRKFDWAPLAAEKIFKGNYNKDMDPEVRTLLNRYYLTSNTELRELTGINYLEQ